MIFKIAGSLKMSAVMSGCLRQYYNYILYF